MHKTISVYFSGTGFSIQDGTFLSSHLYNNTIQSPAHIKMGFNGCGVDFGFRGMIFGTGLDKQCNQVIEQVMQEITAGNTITLNMYGHSRGGIAALLLAKQLGNIDKNKLSIHLALLDPVPGNFITTSTFDPFNISLANKTMDLTNCKPLKKVLALYPYVPLPAVACHAPLLVSYPKGIEVDEEVITGCHAQAENLYHPSAELVQLRVEEFLINNGTQLQTNRVYADKEAVNKNCLTLYEKHVKTVNNNSRDTHSSQGLVITAQTGATYLNQRHKTLMGDTSTAPVALDIKPSGGLLSRLKRLSIAHPFAWQLTKWTLISFSVTSVLFFTGGLAAIPFLAPSALSILAIAPAIGAALAGLWYGIAKPGLSWCASQFYYPFYAMRHDENTPKGPSHDSSNKRTSGLAGPVPQGNSPRASVAPYQGSSPLQSPRSAEKMPMAPALSGGLNPTT